MINKIFFATMHFLITIVPVGRLVRKLTLHNHEIPIVIIRMERARMMSRVMTGQFVLYKLYFLCYAQTYTYMCTVDRIRG